MKVPVQKGPLGDFILRKANSYREPFRKGTPKGEPIGFSEVKYTAMLVGLTNADLRKAARDQDVSYGLLRKWRTEADFKEAMSSHAEEFVDEIIEALRVEIEKNDKAFGKFLGGPFRQLRNGWSSKIDINPLIVGAVGWGGPVNFAFVKRTISLWMRHSIHFGQIGIGFPLRDMMEGIFKALGESSPLAGIDSVLQKCEPIMWTKTIDFVVEGLEKDMSIERRKKAVFHLCRLKRRFEGMGSRDPIGEILAAGKARRARKGSLKRSE